MLINKIYVKKFGGYKIYSDICRGEEYFLSKILIYFNNQHFVFIKKNIYIYIVKKKYFSNGRRFNVIKFLDEFY